MILGGILAMMGHNWSIFLGFKGMALATGLGVLYCFFPFSSIALLPFVGYHRIFHQPCILRLYCSCCTSTRTDVRSQVNLIGLLALVD